MMRKYSVGEVLDEDGDDKVTAKSNWTPQDAKELERELEDGSAPRPSAE